MRLENHENACWFIASDSIYLAGPFYTQDQASSYLKRCTDDKGYTSIKLEGNTYSIPKKNIFVVRDIAWV